MASRVGKPNTNLNDLMAWIDKGELQLPDFQRSWVWNDSKICELLASIASGYPIGALLFLEYGGDELKFKYRPITGAPEGIKPDFLILDGQQRLTSLYGALCSKQPIETWVKYTKSLRYYYIDIRTCVSGGDLSDAIISVPDTKILKEEFGRNVRLDLSTRIKEFEEMKFPLNLTFDSAAAQEWINECMAFYGFDAGSVQTLSKFNYNIVIGIQKYAMHVIDLPKETTKEAVCKIFEKVNTGGVALNAFELVTAMYAADGFDLRMNWDVHRDTMKAAVPLLKEVQSIDFITAITLVSRYNNGSAVSYKRKYNLDLPLSEYVKYAQEVEKGFIKAGNFLREQRIFDARSIPYTTQLIPLAALYVLLGHRLDNHAANEKLKRWYWCGVLGEQYSSAAENRYARDIPEFIAWLDGGEEPDTIQRAYFDPSRFLTLRTMGSAAYKGIMALLMLNGAIDFITGSQMDFTNYTEESIDIHHVFPNNYLSKLGYSNDMTDSIVNKTPLSKRSNRVIGGNAPSHYLTKISEQGKVDEETLNRFIATHLIAVSDIRADRFDDYFEKRKTALLSLIYKTMGKPIPTFTE